MSILDAQSKGKNAQNTWTFFACSFGLNLKFTVMPTNFHSDVLSTQICRDTTDKFSPPRVPFCTLSLLTPSQFDRKIIKWVVSYKSQDRQRPRYPEIYITAWITAWQGRTGWGRARTGAGRQTEDSAGTAPSIGRAASPGRARSRSPRRPACAACATRRSAGSVPVRSAGRCS